MTTTAMLPKPSASNPAAPHGRAHRARRAQAADHARLVGLAIAIGALVTIGLWFRHGGLDAATGPGAFATAAGQLTALVGTYAILVQILFMSRIAWLERAVGLDHLAVWHRWLGFGTVWLITGHVVFTTVGYAQADRVSLWSQTRDFISHYPDVLMAWVGFLLFLGVAVTSVRVGAAEAATGDVVLHPSVRVPRDRAVVRASDRGRQRPRQRPAPHASGGSRSTCSSPARSSGGASSCRYASTCATGSRCAR